MGEVLRRKRPGHERQNGRAAAIGLARCALLGGNRPGTSSRSCCHWKHLQHLTFALCEDPSVGCAVFQALQAPLPKLRACARLEASRSTRAVSIWLTTAGKHVKEASMYDARPDRRGVSANICVRIRVLVQPGLNTSGRQSPLLACAVQWVLAARTLPGSAPISDQ